MIRVVENVYWVWVDTTKKGRERMSEPQEDPNRSLLLWFGTPDGLSPDEAVSWESTPQQL